MSKEMKDKIQKQMEAINGFYDLPSNLSDDEFDKLYLDILAKELKEKQNIELPFDELKKITYEIASEEMNKSYVIIKVMSS